MGDYIIISTFDIFNQNDGMQTVCVFFFSFFFKKKRIEGKPLTANAIINIRERMSETFISLLIYANAYFFGKLFLLMEISNTPHTFFLRTFILSVQLLFFFFS